MINASWYAKYLKEQKNLHISFSNAVIDTIEYQQWKPQQVSVININDTTQKFNWELRPTYLDNYILKGDRILLDIFQQNFFTRPIYFGNHSDSSYNLFLTRYLRSEGLVDRVTSTVFDLNKDSIIISKKFYDYNIDKITRSDIIKSKDAIFILNGFRWAFFNNVYNLVAQNNYEKAKELIILMKEKFPTDKLPFASEEIEQYFSYFFQKIDESDRFH